MNPAIAKLHSSADKGVAFALANEGLKPPCHAGCFWCCKEPVYAELEEIKAALELLTPEQRQEVGEKTKKWVKAFMASGLRTEPEMDAVAYRAFNLWCPFLKDGNCSVYANRPFSCRMHIARESSDGCQHDELRKHQTFANIPELTIGLGQERLYGMKDGEVQLMDHLGLLLSQELTGQSCASAARIKVTIQGESAILERWHK